MALPPSNITEETFIREVDDELRRDDLLTAWQRFGKQAVGGVVLLLAAWGGWIYWNHRNSQTVAGEFDQLAIISDRLGNGNEKGADADLDKVAKTASGKGNRALAELMRAALAQKNLDNKGAVAALQRVAADDAAPQDLKDLAVIRQILIEMDSMKPEAVVSKLKPYAVPGNPWFGTAAELSAVAYVEMGKPELAAKLQADAAKDEQLPESLRSRAVRMASALGADTSAKPAGENVK